MRNKKLAAGIGGATAVAAAVALTAGTFAAFSDSEQRGVIATGGTMDLQISNTSYDGAFTGNDGIVNVGKVVPGETVGKTTFTATNAGDVAGNLSLEFEARQNNENGFTGPEEGVDDTEGEGELLDNLVLTVGNDSGQTITLSDLADYSFEDFARLGGGDEISYTLTLSVPEDAGNDIQGDSAEFRMIANLDQVQN